MLEVEGATEKQLLLQCTTNPDSGTVQTTPGQSNPQCFAVATPGTTLRLHPTGPLCIWWIIKWDEAIR